MPAQLKRLVTAAAALLLPAPLLRPLLRILGHRIAANARIGFSILLLDRIYLGEGTRIGHFNLLSVRRLLMRRDSYIGRLNIINGPLSIQLSPQAAIGNANKIVRGPRPEVTHGPARLALGELAKITADHRIDCTCSVTIGDFSTLAGVGIQVWTHGYVHAESGPDRYRIEGSVRISNNVYIGAGSIISMGVRICSGAMIGAGTTIARSISSPGLYVSGPIRQLPRPDVPQIRADLEQVHAEGLCERVFKKV